MPKPTPSRFDLAALITDVVFAQRVVNPDFKFGLSLPQGGLSILGDERLLGQALTNIVKNAAEALAGRPQTEDNGPGFPQEAREHLREPYVTAKEGGTGLGLAIVNRVIMDHGGSVQLLEPEHGARGAIVKIVLPLSLTSDSVAKDQPLELADEY